MIALLDRVILDVGPCLSWFEILLSSPFMPVKFLLRNQLIIHTIFNQSVSTLITSVLNSVSNRLATSSSLNSIFGPLICSFIRAIFFSSQHSCYVIRGGAFGIHQGRATLFARLWHCMWGRSPRGNNVTWLAFNHFLCYPQANWALLVLIPRWVILYMF